MSAVFINVTFNDFAHFNMDSITEKNWENSNPHLI